MSLPLGLCNFHEIARRQTRRLLEHGTGDFDIVVSRQLSDRLQRRIVDRRQPDAQLGQRPRFDLPDQMAQDLIENRDLVLIEFVAAAQKQIRDPPQRLEAALGRTGLYRGLEFIEQ
ncbi:hypothetical protein [Rhodopseudomonas sp.]|uniref:hypothetical protein n=1 Tax=Rhodopseudomonas sp. TaxID=1078 RepID=UPI003B3B2FC4